MTFIVPYFIVTYTTGMLKLKILHYLVGNLNYHTWEWLHNLLCADNEEEDKKPWKTSVGLKRKLSASTDASQPAMKYQGNTVLILLCERVPTPHQSEITQKGFCI